MKKITLFVLLLISILVAKSQNVQLHYDFSTSRNYLTTTVEKFQPDAYGSTFFFIDFDYSETGPSLAYFELARELKKWDAPFSVHIEYNGGLGGMPTSPFQINNAYLFGGSYVWNAQDFSKGFSVSAMYKNIQGNAKPHNFQLTGVWYLNMLKGKLSFTGFADFWKESIPWLGTEFVFLSEPQLWYNINKTFSIGSEVEVGYNFGAAGLNIFPTLGAKWTIN